MSASPSPAATRTPALKIVGRGVYKITSDSGNTYGIVRGRCSCKGFKAHDHCKHAFFVGQYLAALDRAQAERAKAKRQALNARMFEWYGGLG